MKELGRTNNEETAVDYADKVVRKTQSFTERKDLAQIQRSGFTGRLLTTFRNEQITKYNFVDSVLRRMSHRKISVLQAFDEMKGLAIEGLLFFLISRMRI
jgi:hypothetical protein